MQTDGSPTRDSVIFGILTGLSYTYMAAAWGGFIFVLNLIAVHAVVLFFLGRYSSKVHTAYSLFFIIGTFGATRVPVIGMGPLKSFEQIGALVVFICYQILEFCEVREQCTYTQNALCDHAM